MTPIDIAADYRHMQARIDALVRPLDAAALATPTPTCPGWTVHDVISHLVGNVDWALAGRLAGPPTEEQTAEQVAERATTPTVELLDHWAGVASDFADLAHAAGVFQAPIDALTHDFDIRQALGRTDGRDDAIVTHVARQMLDRLSPEAPVTIVVDGEPIDLGPGSGGPVLETTAFELLRFCVGRRSRAQLAAMAWSSDPEPVLDQLYVFGPAPVDIIE